MTGPAVEVAGLVKHYGDNPAVNRLSLQAAAGAVTAVLGPNGAGKTTTVEICEGYRRADAGRVRVLGLDPATDGRRLRPRIGVMLQGATGIYPGARAGEMLRLIAAFSADPLDPAALLERLGLTAVARTTFRRLSGGQRQRLALAMAVVSRPELVFLDEPTAGLDPQARQVTWELVRELRDDGASVVLTTHDMTEAEHLADHVVIVDAGQAVAAGSVAELLSASSQPALFFRTASPIAAADLLTSLPPDSTIRAEAPGSYVVAAPDVGPALVATVAGWLAERGIEVSDLRIRGGSLEDVFLSLTGRKLRS